MKFRIFASELRKVGISNCSISNAMQTIPQPSLWIINR